MKNKNKEPLKLLKSHCFQLQRAHHADDVRHPHRAELRGHVPHVPRPLARRRAQRQVGRRRDGAVPKGREEEEEGRYDRR